VLGSGLHERVAAAVEGSSAGLVYAVGNLRLTPLARTEAEQMTADFQLHAVGAALAVKALQAALKSGDEAGSVVLCSSIAARSGFSNHVSVSMAKGALEGLTVALAAELAPKVRQDVRLHLSACPACRQALRKLEKVGAVWAEFKAPPVPEGFAERTMQTARKRSGSRQRPASSWRWLRWWWEQPLAMRAAAGNAIGVGRGIRLTMGGALFRPPSRSLAWNVSNRGDPVARNWDFLGGVPAGSVEQCYLDWLAEVTER